jgi:hypothetical protein
MLLAKKPFMNQLIASRQGQKTSQSSRCSKYYHISMIQIEFQ